MKEQIRIKICGLTRLEDIDAVNELKPEYVGFVFAKSRRQIVYRINFSSGFVDISL